MGFNPDDVPMRLFRYVEPGTLPSQTLVCLFDKSQNLLVIDREKFDRLDEHERRDVLRTQRTLSVWDFPTLARAVEADYRGENNDSENGEAA